MNTIDSSIEHVAGEAHGRLVALIASKTGDLQLAQDAVSLALERALPAWRRNGVPQNPAAWLMTAAKNCITDLCRRRSVQERAYRELVETLQTAASHDTIDAWPDERLALMFACAHPAIDRYLHPVLILQCIFGITAQQIAGMYVTSPGALERRLSRAKQKIRESHIPFRVPAHQELSGRLDSVLEAVYGIYTFGLRSYSREPAGRQEHHGEAIYLSGLLTTCYPSEPEVLGLCALLLFCESRRLASSDSEDQFVPFHEQDCARWDRAAIQMAETHLNHAAQHRSLGRFQLEAAIQSAHVVARLEKIDTSSSILQLYRELVARFPSVGAQLGLCAAIGRYESPQAGLDYLVALDAKGIERNQSYWSLRAELLRTAGRPEEARVAYEQAASLALDPALKRFFAKQLRALCKPL